MACICVKEEIFMMQFENLREILLKKVSEGHWFAFWLMLRKDVLWGR
jgi:hypothetical protein